MWEYSLLRLNQLEYFDPLKVDQDSEAHQDPEAGTVDLLLKVKEKGKNSIGLNGGVSGLSGAFLGVNYQTNNFLGLGETLSLQGNLGNVSRQFLFGFSQPYVRNRPLNVGFQIFNNKQDFNAAKNYQATTGQSANLTAAQQSLTQNYNQASDRPELLRQLSAQAARLPACGLHLFADQVDRSRPSAPPRRPSSRPSASGPASRDRTRWRASSTAQISFTYTYNTINNPLRPRSGKEYTAVFQAAGIWRQRALYLAARRLQELHSHALPDAVAERAQRARRCARSWAMCRASAATWLRRNNRFYAGGEGELRGFDVRGATPYGYVPNRVNCAADQS